MLWLQPWICLITPRAVAPGLGLKEPGDRGALGAVDAQHPGQHSADGQEHDQAKDDQEIRRSRRTGGARLDGWPQR